MKENTAMKALAFLLAVAAYTACSVMGWYQLANFDQLWGGDAYGPGDSYTVRYLERQAVDDLECLLNIYSSQARGETLNVYTAQQKTWLEEMYDAKNTNLRWQVLDEGGKVKFGNTKGAIPDRAEGLNWTTYEWSTRKFVVETSHSTWKDYAQDALNVDMGQLSTVHSDNWRAELEGAYDAATKGEGAETAEPPPSTTIYLDADGEGDLLLIGTDGGTYVYAPTVQSMLETNRFGYRYSIGEGWQQVDSEQGGKWTYELVMWPDPELPVDDRYAQAIHTMEDWTRNREVRLFVTLLCGAAGLLLTVYLCVGAGHKEGVDGITLNWFHRLPGDLLAAVAAGAVFLLVCLAFEFMRSGYFYGRASMLLQLLVVGAIVAAAAALCLALLVTAAARCKARTLLCNTLLWRFCHWCRRLCWQGCCAVLCVIQAVPLVWKVVAFGVTYFLLTVLLFERTAGLWVLLSGLMLAAACLWAYQWKKLRHGAREIIRGNPDYHIDTAHMFSDLKGHADELNSLGQAVSAAVDERMRSERFKAELITNVSHDLKTPLTSIINYVDLLKKENIDNPRAAEYIDVLDRKSQRLKKLTEDLVEASKASTGNLAVSLERLGLAELADQALAEYSQRLEAQGLTVVRVFPEQEVWVNADGRHLWRVLDNLLGNCAKYALAGTRVYVEVRTQGGCGVLSVKNISRDELNVSPESLLERFVRGDESRTTEGSGLGLSIAQSLTELQHGRFQLEIDGDLFKAAVSLPLFDGGAGPALVL